MNERASLFLSLTPRDPIVARDGRPFGTGLRMRSLDWMYPSVLAGALRTLLGGRHGGFDPEALKQVGVAGPFPSVVQGEGHELYLPAPKDIVVQKDPASGQLRTHAIRPAAFPDGAGCNGVFEGDADGQEPGSSLEGQRLYPLALPPVVLEGFKPVVVPAFWATGPLARWLASAGGGGFLPPTATGWTEGFLKAPEKDVRTHVQMESGTGAGREGALFQSTGLEARRFPRPGRSGVGIADTVEAVLAARVEATGSYAELVGDLDHDHPLGGERRLVHWRAAPPVAARSWECPAEIRDALTTLSGRTGLRGVRAVLASPGAFSTGWRPEWLVRVKDGWEGSPPGFVAKELHLRLIGAVVDRWRPISGWSLDTGPGRMRNPKPIRRLVPAGSVYFFHVVEGGDPRRLAERWLQPIGNDVQAGRDGFGLAIWGVWRPHDERHTFGV